MNYRAPSLQRIAEAFSLDRESAAKVRRLIQNCDGSGRSIERTMERIDAIIETCGVESVRLDDCRGGYWQDCAAVYCNAGDSYVPTILYSVGTDTFRLTDLDTFAETYKGPGRLA